MPSALPLAEVMPRLLRLCAPEEPVGGRPRAWILARPGENGLDPGHTLAESGVADGEVLELRTHADDPAPVYVEDVRDAIEDAVDATGRQWDATTSLGYALATGGAAVALAVLLPGVREPRDSIALAAAISVAAFLVPAVAWAGRHAGVLLAQFLIGVACLWGGMAGWLASTWLSTDRFDWLVAGLGLALVAAATRSITPLATPHVAAAAVLLAAAGGTASLASRDDAVRALALGAVMVIGGLPRASLTLGGLAAADYRVRNAALLTEQALAGRIRQSSWLLTGALTAIAVVSGAGGIYLAYEPGAWDRLLAGAIGAGLLLRSRLFSRIPHVLPARLAGLAVLAALALRHADEVSALAPWLGMLALVAAVVLTAASAIPASEITRARIKQLLNWSEYVVMTALVALAAGAFGLYDLVADRTGG